MCFLFVCARLQLPKISCLCYFNRHSPANSSCYELPLQAWSWREKTAVSWRTAISLQWQQQQCWCWWWWLVTLSPTVVRRETLSTCSFLTACEYTPSIDGHHIECWEWGLIYKGNQKLRFPFGKLQKFYSLISLLSRGSFSHVDIYTGWLVLMIHTLVVCFVM